MARRESPDGSSQLHSSPALQGPTQAGDGAALELLTARYLPRLQPCASARSPRRARDMADTQGHVQETLFQTFKRIEKFHPRGRRVLQAYLRQAIVNRIRELLDKPSVDAARTAAERAIIRLAEQMGKTRS